MRPSRPRTTILAAALRLLRTAGVEAPERELRLLLAHAYGLEEGVVPRAGIPPVRFMDLVARRAAREPLALIRGYREFWGLRFAVSPATLVPRPESETLIEAALATFPDRCRPLRVLDLGTGSGCLLLAVLAEFPAAFGVGTDRVVAAVELARANAGALNLGDRAAFLAGDWGSPLAGSFDLVLANPPYVVSAAIPELMPEVARYEPASALDGGTDGRDAYRRIFADLPRLLEPSDGCAVVELGAGTATAVIALACAAGLAIGAVYPDISRVPRALVLRRCHEKTVWQSPSR